MKTKIEIKHFLTGSILFEFEKENNTIKDTVVEANLRGADLYGANLRRANLSEADLRRANLSGANLSEANLYGANGLDLWWHLHHEILFEQLTEPIKNRINYIKDNKPKEEVALRLRLLKPMLSNLPKTDREIEALHAEECGCSWDGKTIFTEKNKSIKPKDLVNQWESKIVFPKEKKII